MNARNQFPAKFKTTLLITGAMLTASAFIAQVSVSRVALGASAVSINSVNATLIQTGGALGELCADPSGTLLYFHLKDRKTFGALNVQTDSVAWLQNGLSGNPVLAGTALIASGARGAVIDKKTGKTLLELPSPVLATFSANHVLTYSGKTGDEVACLQIPEGTVKWTAAIPASEDWIDVKKVDDSLWIVAASGIHAIHPGRGLLWTLPQSTSDNPEKAEGNDPSFNPVKWQSIGAFRETAASDRITQVGSNIWTDGKVICFAGREKMVCVNRAGNTLWSVPLGHLTLGKMMLQKNGNSLWLMNTAAAWKNQKMIAWGSPFLWRIDIAIGNVTGKWENDVLEGLTDLLFLEHSIRLATREAIFETADGQNLKTVSLIDPSYGSVAELIDGRYYHALKEGYFVPLNQIDNAIYYRADNNKIYALERNNVKMEYNSSAVYHYERRAADKIFLCGTDRILVTDPGFELQCSLKASGAVSVSGDKIYISQKDRIYSLRIKDLE